MPLAPTTVGIRRQSWTVRAWRRIRKHPALSALAAVAILLLGGVLVLSKLQRDDTQRKRFENSMRGAAIAVERGLGDPAGPPGLFDALTGLPRPDSCEDLTAPDFTVLVDRAEQIDPDDERPRQLREAFGSDPAPEATQALALGQGFVADRMLTGAIERLEANSGLSTRDGPTLMRLYRLYLARAVANLMPANAHPSVASKDLIKASMLRPRSFFPRVLTTILDWPRGSDVTALERALTRVLEGAPAGGRIVVGHLLVALARIGPQVEPNLLEFELDYGTRRAIHDLGTSWVGPDAVRSPGNAMARERVEARLHRAAARALAVASSQVNREAELQTGREILATHVAPDAPLSSWQIVFELIGDPRAGVDRLQPSFDTEVSTQQVRALTEFMRLDPPRTVVDAVWPAAEILIDALPNPRERRVSRVRAMFLARTGPPDRAVEAANTWVAADANDPEAYFCRMRCCASSDARKAVTEAVNAIQRSANPSAMRDRVIWSLQAAARTNADLVPMVQKFQAGT